MISGWKLRRCSWCSFETCRNRRRQRCQPRPTTLCLRNEEKIGSHAARAFLKVSSTATMQIRLDYLHRFNNQTFINSYVWNHFLRRTPATPATTRCFYLTCRCVFFVLWVAKKEKQITPKSIQTLANFRIVLGTSLNLGPFFQSWGQFRSVSVRFEQWKKSRYSLVW